MTARDFEALLSRIGPPSKLHLARPGEGERAASIGRVVRTLASLEPADSLEIPWPGLDEVLPDGGLPRGVVELSAPHALGGCTSLALTSVRAGLKRGARAWCAWIDPQNTLHAPGVDSAGVDLDRLLVVRPPLALAGRVALKVVASGAFEVVVVDLDCVPGACAEAAPHTSKRKSGWSPEVLVRKLAIAAEPGATTVLLLTDATRPRSVPWPVALRLEVSRPSANELRVRVAKDRRGRVGAAKTVPFVMSCPIAR
ncbi:MAG TPA: recombinase A [Polyangiaceae bacterium]|nr:recombinase A [Polyangiaceae bacterium]